MPERDAAPETLLALMKTNGVARTVIIQVIHYKYDNRYLASPRPPNKGSSWTLMYRISQVPAGNTWTASSFPAFSAPADCAWRAS